MRAGRKRRNAGAEEGVVYVEGIRELDGWLGLRGGASAE
jgi:hypothetical protein